jgi:RHS repeat-associated protein
MLLKTNINHYPFGSPMLSRSFNAPEYKYGFNGKENDKEVIGTGSGTQDYGMRIYNPSLGKFLSVDPLQKEFAWNSSYAFAENDVIRATDLDGAEKNFVVQYKDKSGAMLWHTVPYSKIHPGQEFGPLGQGDYEYSKDVNTGKMVGNYRETFAEAHPVKNFFGSEYNGRYDGKKGVRQLGKDAAPVLQTTGKVLKVTGTIASAIPHPIAQAYSKGAMLAGEYIGDAGDALEIIDAAADGDINKAGIKSVNLVLNKVAGKVIDKTAGSEPDANIASTSLDLISDAGSDAFVDLANKNDKAKKTEKTEQK